MNEGNVYVLSNPLLNGFVKIGNTINIDSRLSTLNTALPEDMVVEYVGNFEDYKIVERDAHQAFMAYHHNREWFRVNPHTAVAFLKHHRNLIDEEESAVEDTEEVVVRTRKSDLQLDDYFEEGNEFTCSYGVIATYVGNNYVDVEGVVEKYSTPAKRLYGNSIAGADFWRVSDDLTIRQYVNAITS